MAIPRNSTRIRLVSPAASTFYKIVNNLSALTYFFQISPFQTSGVASSQFTSRFQVESFRSLSSGICKESKEKKTLILALKYTWSRSKTSQFAYVNYPVHWCIVSWINVTFVICDNRKRTIGEKMSYLILNACKIQPWNNSQQCDLIEIGRV